MLAVQDRWVYRRWLLSFAVCLFRLSFDYGLFVPQRRVTWMDLSTPVLVCIAPTLPSRLRSRCVACLACGFRSSLIHAFACSDAENVGGAADSMRSSPGCLSLSLCGIANRSQITPHSNLARRNLGVPPRIQPRSYVRPGALVATMLQLHRTVSFLSF